MCPPTTAPLLDIGEHCSDEELFMSLKKFVCGGPLPMNVTCDINPHHYKPEDLPVGLWYFIVLQNHIAMAHAAWKATEGPRRIFSNDLICGWRTTYTFRDQQPSNNSTVDWLMQEYMITRNGIDDKTIGKDARALCRVYRNCPSLIEQDLQQGLGTPGNSTNLSDLNSPTREGKASTSNRWANNIEAAVNVTRDNPPNQENVPDADWDVLQGDFLEIDDLLDNPQSPSSSSGNSSCLTISSNECFDSLGFLQDIENENFQDLEKQGADQKFNVASVKPDRIVTCALSPDEIIHGSYTGRNPDHKDHDCLFFARICYYRYTCLPKQGIIEERQNPGSNPPVRSQTLPLLRDGTRLVGGLKCLKNCASCPFSSTSSHSSNLQIGH